MGNVPIERGRPAQYGVKEKCFGERRFERYISGWFANGLFPVLELTGETKGQAGNTGEKGIICNTYIPLYLFNASRPFPLVCEVRKERSRMNLVSLVGEYQGMMVSWL